MNISDFLTPERVMLDVRVRDKPHLISEIARSFGRLTPGVQPRVVETALLAREHLGSTGLGSAFALPHARIDDMASYQGLFMRLAKSIDYAAIDDKPVGLVFVLLIPAATTTPHVAALAAISRRFRDTGVVTQLLKVKRVEEAYGLLTNG
jgi:PTS system nitrogen regulatory IIA component